MRNLIVLCGLPGSGKTTLSKEIAITYNMKRISMDEGAYLKHSDMIKSILSNLLSGNHVVVDSVYLEKGYRKRLLQSVHDIDCKKILIHIATPLDECIKRNRERINPLPDSILESMDNIFERPSLDEGWDEIITIS